MPQLKTARLNRCILCVVKLVFHYGYLPMRLWWRYRRSSTHQSEARPCQGSTVEIYSRPLEAWQSWMEGRRGQVFCQGRKVVRRGMLGVAWNPQHSRLRAIADSLQANWGTSGILDIALRHYPAWIARAAQMRQSSLFKSRTFISRNAQRKHARRIEEGQDETAGQHRRQKPSQDSSRTCQKRRVQPNVQTFRVSGYSHTSTVLTWANLRANRFRVWRHSAKHLCGSLSQYLETRPLVHPLLSFSISGEGN